MTVSRPFLSSVTRWLLMVVGCAVLETAQPMSAATTEPAPTAATVEATPALAPDAPTPATAAAPAEAVAGRGSRNAETLLIPGGTARPSLEGPRTGTSFSWLVVLGFCAGGAAWYWWRRRGAVTLGRPPRLRQIEIQESRPLGNRQYLVVATVGPRKFLLGITPGSIQMLAPLEPNAEPAHETVA